ncbi:hypothetical protein [uncultured Microbulbifer sp.]|nr:hypothetical protein [uncultured Microbulbifer sp.]
MSGAPDCTRQHGGPVLHRSNGAETDQVGEQAVQFGDRVHGGMVR